MEEEKSDAENDLDITNLMWGLGDGGPQGGKGTSFASGVRLEMDITTGLFTSAQGPPYDCM